MGISNLVSELMELCLCVVQDWQTQIYNIVLIGIKFHVQPTDVMKTGRGFVFVVKYNCKTKARGPVCFVTELPWRRVTWVNIHIVIKYGERVMTSLVIKIYELWD